MKAARDYPILTVTAKGTRWLESGHPWVYDSDVAREPDESECENGALVDVVSEKGKYLGTGFLSRLSKLRVRIVSRNANDRFDENFWRRRVRYAWDYQGGHGRADRLLPPDLRRGRCLPGSDGRPV